MKLQKLLLHDTVSPCVKEKHSPVRVPTCFFNWLNNYQNTTIYCIFSTDFWSDHLVNTVS